MHSEFGDEPLANRTSLADIEAAEAFLAREKRQNARFLGINLYLMRRALERMAYEVLQQLPSLGFLAGMFAADALASAPWWAQFLVFWLPFAVGFVVWMNNPQDKRRRALLAFTFGLGLCLLLYAVR